MGLPEGLGIALEWEEIILAPTVAVLGYTLRKLSVLSERVAWLEGRGGHQFSEATDNRET